jgi:hypothetical protein
MKTKRMTGAVLLICSVIGVGATCYTNTFLDCPSSVRAGGGTCDLKNDGHIPSFTVLTDPGRSGLDSYTWDNTPHCEYQCPDGFHWFNTGWHITGENCIGGQDGGGSGSGT